MSLLGEKSHYWEKKVFAGREMYCAHNGPIHLLRHRRFEQCPNFSSVFLWCLCKAFFLSFSKVVFFVMSSSCKDKFLWCLLSVRLSSWLLVRLSSVKVIFLSCPIPEFVLLWDFKKKLTPQCYFLLFTIFSQIFWIPTEGGERWKFQKNIFSQFSCHFSFFPCVARFFGPPLWGGSGDQKI